MGAKLLTDKHKMKRMGSALDSLTQYEEGGDIFVDHIVTGDETRVSYVNVEQNRQSMGWNHTSSPQKFVKRRKTFSTQIYFIKRF